MAWRLSRYDRGAKLISTLAGLGKSVRGLRIVDLGAAHGGDSCAFVDAGGNVTAADFRDYAYGQLVQRINAVAHRPGHLSAFVASANAPLPIATKSVDLVLAFGLIEHVELEPFFKEMSRVLRPDGWALMVVDVSLKSPVIDPLFSTPYTTFLPMGLRRLVAERLLGGRYEFPLGKHTFYSVMSVANVAKKAGFSVTARKYPDSPIARRIETWPLPGLWRRLVERYAFDFLILEKTK